MALAQQNDIAQHLPHLFSEDIMCAGSHRSDYGTCKGDSGGPLVKLVTDQGEHFDLIGNLIFYYITTQFIVYQQIYFRNCPGWSRCLWKYTLPFNIYKGECSSHI